MQLFSTLILASLMLAAPQGSKGEMLSLNLENSERYPGTHRHVEVYVPQGYRDGEAACLLVRMDGTAGASDLPAIMDELIEEGAMPMTIGLFIQPGQICNKEGNVVRYNRSNEFDRMTSTWAEFIEYEVIPSVEKLKTSDGRGIKISRKPQDRAITGSSSGGIAAFTAAWQRPDLYGRVYSVVGTFVPFRGGNDYPALIRKTEPKPIRIYLQDNDKDSWNETFGSWYEYNLIMASALEYAGYDIQTHWDKGGHNGTNGERIMKDVMRWLWKGWPEPLEVRKTSNPLLSDVLIVGESWRETDRMEGKPQKKAIYPGGAFIVRPKPHTDCLMAAIINENGKETDSQEFYWLHGESGSDFDRNLAFDTDGWLYVSSELGIQICDQNGRVRGILSCPAGRLEAFSFVGNNLYVRVDGHNYVRHINHTAATKDSATPKSQGQG